MTWRFTPDDRPAEPVAGASGLRAALGTAGRVEAMTAWLNLAHRADPGAAATYARVLSANPDLTDAQSHLATRAGKRPSPARLEDLAQAARDVNRSGATIHRRIARNLEAFGDVIIAGCPTDADRHRHQRTPGGWLCGDTVKRGDTLIDPRPDDR
ncbi:hypothetical protein [Ornithinimicrobium murale]|uniref:hypothetical protein n=1 Tax=Ornithinimicrobium murale TaxID=1050153 RepID=UPI000E0D72BC|nr:hypothetical protein [Ornithinimicrobium murale]